VHRGHIKPDSDGQGASFNPSRKFRPGELVTVNTTLPVLGGHGGSFKFRIDDPATPPVSPVRSAVPRTKGDVQRFYSRRDLRPATVRLSRPYPSTSDILLTPMHGPLQWGPMIIGRGGSLVWFKPISGVRTTVADLDVQHYRGQPVLTWWQGSQNFGGPGPNKDVIVDRSYRQIATVRAGNGLTTDIHEFDITPQNTALITAYSTVYLNDPTIGARHVLVANCFVQEIDIPTGNVLFQWDSLDHIPLSDSYIDPTPAPFNDYFHINSVAQDVDGNFVVSARNTSAVYKIDRRTGRVLWELGGKHSSFRMGPGTSTAFQHDATIHPGGRITIFDNGDWPQVHPQSRAVLERINTRRHTATLIRQFDHSPSLLSPFEGSVQLVPGGNVFVGWGGLPYFTEFDARGRQIFDGRFVDANSSYRVYAHVWQGDPTTRPALAVIRPSSGTARAYVSWNGATDVSRWRLLEGSTPNRLSPVAAARRSGFETSMSVPNHRLYFAVQAIGASGRVLAESRTISARGPGHRRPAAVVHR
jgi:hypothetical protein